MQHPAAPVRSASVRWLAVLVLLVVVVGGLGYVPAARSISPSPAVAHVGVPTPDSAAAPPPALPRPSAGTQIQLFQNTSSFENVPQSEADCFPFIGATGCYVQAQDPTLVTLPDAAVGVGYSVLTHFNSTNFGECPSAPYTATRVAFAVSPNNGTSFNAPTYLPSPTTPCDYVQQLEPTFSVSGTVLWGAYVATNATPSALLYPAASSNPPVLQWTNRSSDAIAVVNSTDNGSTFGTPDVVLSGANLADPELATFGDTIYLLYQDIANGTSYVAGGSTTNVKLPVSEQLIYSSDGGVTWSAPVVLPGENSSQFYTTMGGSIAVSSTGTVAVAYATNRGCIDYCSFGSYAVFGDDIVTTTSTSNGTSWTALSTVAPGQGEIVSTYSPPAIACSQFSPSGTGLCMLDQDSPMTSLAWGAGGHLFVAWDAAVNRSVTSLPAYYYNYDRTEIFAGGSSDSGAHWKWGQVSAQLSNETSAQSLINEEWFTPALGYSAGTVYLTFSYLFWGSASGYAAYGSNFAANSYSQWVATSTNGYNYTPPRMIDISTRSDALAYYHDMGEQASVGFSSSGAPVFAYAVADGWFLNVYPGTYCFVVTMSVSTEVTGPTTNVTFEETGLSLGSPWQFGVDGEAFDATTATYNVSGVPVGSTITVTWPGTPKTLGYRAELEPEISAPVDDLISGPSTVWFNFTTFYGLNFSASPNNPDLTIYFDNYGPGMQYDFYAEWYTEAYGGAVYHYVYGNPLPWYFPAGTKFSIGPVATYPLEVYYYTTAFVGYWNGTGAGSYTGGGNIGNVTVLSPFNETLWDIAVGTYGESFDPIGLAASSTYSFDVDGVRYGAGGTTPTVVSNLTTGMHSVTNITATSTQSGWQYFGRSAGGNPLFVPAVPVDNLTFAFVNTSALPGTVSFHAVGVTNGSAWQVSFNGTVYGATTPWINVTTRPGTFSVSAGNVVSSNGSATLTPSGFGPMLNVTTGQVYAVNFTGSYELSVLTSAGGTVSPSGTTYWLAPNSTKSLNATPAAGYSWGGWTGTGPGSYTGLNQTAVVRAQGPVQEAASFIPEVANRFTLTVNETGIATGTSWTVFLNGRGYSSTQPTLTVPNLYSCAVSGSIGNYAVFVPAVAGSTGTQYLPAAGTPSTACVTQTLRVTYDTQFAVSVASTSGGVVTGAAPSGVTWVDNGSSLQLSETPAGGYTFLGWTGTGPGSLTSTAPSITVTPAGPVGELAAWTTTVQGPPTRTTVSFVASAQLPTGTEWSVDFNGTSYAASTGTITVGGVLNGTYPVSAAAVGGEASGVLYSPTLPEGSVPVHGTPVNVPVTFSASYWVSVTGVGPGTVSASQWVGAGKTVTLNASPTGTALFEGWVGTGPGSYSGASQGPSVRVTGPVHEVATFVGAPSSTTTPSSSASPSTALIVGLAIVGLVAGLAVGVLLGRRRPPTSGESP